LSNGASLSGGLGTSYYSTNIAVAGGATLDVSGLSSTFTLVSGQVLSNMASATGILKGNVTTSPGSTIGLSYLAGTPALTVTGGTLTLGSGTIIKVNNSGGVLAPGSYLLISASGSGAVAISGIIPPAVTVTGGNGNYSSVNTLYVSGGQLYLWVDPVAENFTLAANVGTPVTNAVIPKFAWSANGDKLTLTISGNPTNGTATVTGSSNIVYTATGGTNDSFTYTVTDSSYGTAASAKVTVVINPTGQSYNSLNPPIANGDGTVTVGFLGIPGDSYALDWTHSLTPPVTWLPLLTNAAPVNGILLFTNTPSGGSDFYRTRFISHP